MGEEYVKESKGNCRAKRKESELCAREEERREDEQRDEGSQLVGYSNGESLVCYIRMTRRERARGRERDGTTRTRGGERRKDRGRWMYKTRRRNRTPQIDVGRRRRGQYQLAEKKRREMTRSDGEEFSIGRSK